jgi:hypothetical protein
MRTYTFEWEEKTNTILFKPTSNNKGGVIYRLSKKDFCTFILETAEKKIEASLDSCILYLKDEMEKEDFISLVGFLYSWGQYNGARIN